MTSHENLTTRTILQKLCKDRDYFEFKIKLGTNMQNGYNLRDQIVYSLIKMLIKEVPQNDHLKMRDYSFLSGNPL